MGEAISGNLGLVKRLAKTLRYQPLPQFVGRQVMIRREDTVEADIRNALGNLLPPRLPFVGPERPFLDRAMAKYGIIDVTFRAPDTWLEERYQTGVPLLRELGFLTDPSAPKMLPDNFLEDPTCLNELDEDLSHHQTFLRLWLDGGPPTHRTFDLPPGYLPRPFLIRDACVANARFVWFLKHFYI